MKQDKELNHFHGTLWEFDRHFLPSYPFEENINMITTASSSKMIANSYMKTRCPAWCDRVLMNNTAKQLLIKNENQLFFATLTYSQILFQCIKKNLYLSSSFIHW